MMKRILSLMLCVCMIVGLFSGLTIPVGAANVASGTCGENVTWVLDSEGTLTISGTGDMASPKNISEIPWYSNRASIKTAVIDDGVTSIGRLTFLDCSMLTSVTISDSVTSIGDSAFKNCTALPEITIPASVTSIELRAFDNCTALKSITIPSSMTSTGSSVFEHCTALTSVTISDGVTSIGVCAFKNCTALTEITIPASVTHIWHSAFENCTSLTDVHYTGTQAQWDAIPIAIYNEPLTKVNIHYEWTGGVTEVASGTCGENVTWVLDSEGTLTISGTGAMADYYAVSLNDEINTPWMDYLTSIRSVVIEDGVTSIGEGAFEECTELTEITIPDSVTSIGCDAFFNCRSLQSITLPDGLTELKGHWEVSPQFYDCTSLQYNVYGGAKYLGSAQNPYMVLCRAADRAITACNVHPDTKFILDWAFDNCTALAEITIPDGVTSIGNYAFTDCTALTEITIPDGVTGIGGCTFYKCTALTEITIPASVTSIGWAAFDYCTALADVNYCGTQAQWNAIEIEDGFNECLTGATIHYEWTPEPTVTEVASGTCGENVTWVLDSEGTLIISGTGAMADYYAASIYDKINTPWMDYLTSIRSVVIEDGVTSIGEGAFAWCAELTEITIPDSVTSIGCDAFCGCESLQSITLPNGLTELKGYWELSPQFSGCTSLQYNVYGGAKYLGSAQNPYMVLCRAADRAITACNVHPDTKFILDCAFEDCTALTEITIPDGVTSIGSCAFDGCTALTEITIPASVTYIEPWTFGDCTALTEITIPASVTSIGSCAFYECTALKKVTIGNGVTSIGECAFEWCAELTEITIPDSVTSIGWDAFAGCTALTDVNYCGTQAQWNAITIGKYNECLTAATIHFTEPEPTVVASGTCGENVTWTLDSEGMLTISGTGAMADYGAYDTPWYSYRESITNAVIENGVTSVGRCAFYECTALAEITIPGSVTSIESWAFFGCTALPEITIPGSVTIIGDGAFGCCTKLARAVLGNGVTSIGGWAFEWCYALAEITIPASVTSIGIEAFLDCTALTDVNYCGTQAQWNAITIGEFNGFLTGATMHYEWTPESGGTTEEPTPEPTVTEVATKAELDAALASGATEITLTADIDFDGTLTVPAGVTLTAVNGATLHGTVIAAVACEADFTRAGTEFAQQFKLVNNIALTGNIDIGAKNLNYNYYVVTGGKILTAGTVTGMRVSFPITGKCGDGLTWTLKASGTLVISGEGDMWDFADADDVPWAEYRSLIRKVVIEGGVTRVSDRVFAQCTSMKSVSIPSSVTSVGEKSFEGCSQLVIVELPIGVTSIGKDAFKDCSGLSTVSIPNTVKKIEKQAFDGCEKLTKVAIPYGVTTIGDYAFYQCTELLTVEIPRSVNRIGNYAFYGCTGLTSVEIPGSVESIGVHAFEGCTALANVAIGDGLTDIARDAFRGCSALAEIWLPATVERIGDNAFLGCTALANVYYGAMQTQWNEIEIGVGNESLTGAAFHFSAKSTIDGELDETHRKYQILATGHPEYLNNDACHTVTRNAVSVCSDVQQQYDEGDEWLLGYAETFVNLDELLLNELFASWGWTQSTKEQWLEANTGEYLRALQNEETAADIIQKSWKTFAKSYAGVKAAVNAASYTSLEVFAEIVCKKAPMLTPSTVNAIASDLQKNSVTYGFNAQGKILKAGKYAVDMVDVILYTCQLIEIDLELMQRVMDLTPEHTPLHQSTKKLYDTIRNDENFVAKRYLSKELVNITADVLEDIVEEMSTGASSSVFWTYKLVRISAKVLYSYVYKGAKIDDIYGSVIAYDFYQTCASKRQTLMAQMIRNKLNGVATDQTLLDDYEFVYMMERVALAQYIDACENINRYSDYDSLLEHYKACTADDGVLGFANYVDICFNTLKREAQNGTVQCNHEWTRTVSATDPTCTESGTEVFTCEICGATMNKTLPAFGHLWKTQSTKSATCTEPGGHTRVCAVCGERETEAEIAPLGHDFTVAVTRAATAEESGYRALKCSHAGCSEIQIVEVLPVLAPSTVAASGTCGENVTWTLDNSGVLTVSGTGAMESTPWSAYGENVTTVLIGDGVTTVADRAFADCAALASVTLGNGVTTVGDSAFAGCALTEITVPDSVTGIDASAFAGCASLAEVTLGDGIVRIGDRAFADCALTDVSYGGTKAQWNAVEIGSGNEALLLRMASYHEHTWDEGVVTLAPTCTEAGVIEYTCTVDGVTVTAVLPALGHSFTSYVSDGNATCAVDGTKTATCDRCGATDTVTDESSHREVAHTPDGNTDCASASYCAVCGAVLRAVGVHTWDEGVVALAPTCTEAGEMLRTCTVCGETRTREIPALGHDLVHHDAKAATCTEDGRAEYDTCTRCDYTTYAVISATGHVYDDGADMICNVCGYDRTPVYTLGDADGNGVINTVDASLTLMFYVDAENHPLTAEQRAAADVNGDGHVNTIDSAMILWHYVGTCGATCPMHSASEEPTPEEPTPEEPTPEEPTPEPELIWALAEDVPEGAETVSEKWTYTKTSTATSESATMDGWTLTGSDWQLAEVGEKSYATFPSGFDTAHRLYSTVAKAPYTAYENESEKVEVSNSFAGYIYYHWMYNCVYANVTTRAISSERLQSGIHDYAFIYFYAFASSVDCPYLDNYYCNDQGVASYNCSSVLPETSSLGIGTPRFCRFNYYTSAFSRYQKLYSFEKQEELESSVAVTAGDGISDVRHYVQYRSN